MDSCGFLRILVDSCGFLWILVDSCGFLWQESTRLSRGRNWGANLWTLGWCRFESERGRTGAGGVEFVDKAGRWRAKLPNGSVHALKPINLEAFVGIPLPPGRARRGGGKYVDASASTYFPPPHGLVQVGLPHPASPGKCGKCFLHVAKTSLDEQRAAATRLRREIRDRLH